MVADLLLEHRWRRTQRRIKPTSTLTTIGGCSEL
jgi:hypothetical protein